MFLDGEIKMNGLKTLKADELQKTALEKSCIDDIGDLIQNLLTDPNYLILKKTLGASNLFRNLAASHKELWHSAFIKWVLDPKSDTGLGDFALKCFLHLALKCYTPNQSPSGLTLCDLETLKNLDAVSFDLEKSISLVEERRRIDVYAEAAVSKISGDVKKLRIIIENKVLAGETNDQTEAYATWAEAQTNVVFDYDFLIFLTPFSEQKPKNKDFVIVTYDQFYQSVLRPCLRHPDLNAEGKYLLEQYVLNLGTPVKNGKPMANTRKEICVKIYEAHKELLNEIFLAADEIGKQPNSEGEATTKEHIGVSLENLVERDFLKLTDTLHKNVGGKLISALLVKNDDAGVAIVVEGKEYTSPSRAANAVTGQSINGWTFWEVKDETGKSKGNLDALRKLVIQAQ
jgi:hypothetical protein